MYAHHASVGDDTQNYVEVVWGICWKQKAVTGQSESCTNLIGLQLALRRWRVAVFKCTVYKHIAWINKKTKKIFQQMQPKLKKKSEEMFQMDE